MGTETWLVWVLIGGLSVIAFASRALFILPARQLTLSPALKQLLRYAPAAALTAIIVPDLARMDGVVSFSLANPRLAAGAVAFAVAARTGNILLTIVCGMASLLVARLMFG